MSRIVLVTGMSGAGRATALRALEDQGYETVDNLPLDLLRRLFPAGGPPDRALAIGVDSRTRAFDPGRLKAMVDQLRATTEGGAALLFLDCDDEVLARRYSETRRRHPLAFDRPVADGIASERVLLADLKEQADHVIDTTQLAVGDLKRLLSGIFALAEEPGLTICLMSFSYRLGLPREADIVFDVRFLANPHYVPDLRPLTGLDASVQAYVAGDPDAPVLLERIEGMLVPLLPRFRAEGKSYLTIAIGCTGGKHRSVFMAETLGRRFGQLGWATTILHRDLPRALDATERTA